MLKGKGMILVVVFILALPALSMAAVNLPETGQTTCFDVGGSVIACAGTGQDGDILAGIPWPSPRFTVNGDGTVTDRLTKLIWLQNANCFSTGTWTQALSDANTLSDSSCGLTDGSAAGDWRLPNINELESLVNAEEANPATWLNGQGFTNVQSYYISSTAYAYFTNSKWTVSMWAGGVYPSTGGSVWPVRGGFFEIQ